MQRQSADSDIGLRMGKKFHAEAFRSNTYSFSIFDSSCYSEREIGLEWSV